MWGASARLPARSWPGISWQHGRSARAVFRDLRMVANDMHNAFALGGSGVAAVVIGVCRQSKRGQKAKLPATMDAKGWI